MAAIEAVNLSDLRTVSELRARERQLVDRVAELNKEAEGRKMSEVELAEFRSCTEEAEKIRDIVTELEARRKTVETLSKGTTSVEDDRDERVAPGVIVKNDPYEVRNLDAGWANPARTAQGVRDNALRAISQERFPLTEDSRDRRAYGKSNEDVQAHIEGLIRGDESGAFSRYLLATGHPSYRTAFAKLMRGGTAALLSTDEQKAVERATSIARQFTLGTTGLPVTYTLDPTLVPVSNGAVNPWRQICNVTPVQTNEWQGATVAAITASYAAEDEETTDNKPTLARPAFRAHRAQVFIPFSREAGQDWGSLQAEMARSIADSKDTLEAEKFWDGDDDSAGSGEPQGLDTGLDSTREQTTASPTAVSAADLYALETKLGPRFRARASLVGNRAIFNKVRGIDTAGGAALWIRIGDGLPNLATGRLGQALMGYPTFEASEMPDEVDAGERILILGDFSYYRIIERIGMSVEVIPHLFGTARNYPNGMSGLYAFWRNGGGVVNKAAFALLRVITS